MGLLDRDYYRDDSGGPLAAWLRQGMASKILVAINIFVFIVQIATQTGRPTLLSGPVNEGLSLIGERVLHGEVWRLLTYGFLNPTAHLIPVLFNIPLLWVIGHEVEERLGWRKFLGFYLTAIVVCGLALVGAEFLGMNGASPERTRVVGCSAAITAMLAWLIAREPRLRLTFFYALTVPAWLVLLVSVGTDTIGLAWPKLDDVVDGRRITLAGHLGGLLFAMMFFGLMRQGRGRPSRQQRRRRRDDDPDLRIFREQARNRAEVDDDTEEPEPAPVPANPDLDEHLEAQLDAVLAKVAERGKESLTGPEREVLQRASEVYRKRRR